MLNRMWGRPTVERPRVGDRDWIATLTASHTDADRAGHLEASHLRPVGGEVRFLAPMKHGDHRVGPFVEHPHGARSLVGQGLQDTQQRRGDEQQCGVASHQLLLQGLEVDRGCGKERAGDDPRAQVECLESVRQRPGVRLVGLGEGEHRVEVELPHMPLGRWWQQPDGRVDQVGKLGLVTEAADGELGLEELPERLRSASRFIVAGGGVHQASATMGRRDPA